MKHKTTIYLLAALCAAAIAAALALAFTGGQPDFVPPPFDPAAQSGVPDVPEDAGYGQLDAKAFRFSAAGALTVRNGAVDVWLTNPDGSGVWLKVRLLAEDGTVLGESGLLRSGQYVRSVALDTVPQETMAVTLKIMAYEPDTYYSAGSVTLQTQLNAA